MSDVRARPDPTGKQVAEGKKLTRRRKRGLKRKREGSPHQDAKLINKFPGTFTHHGPGQMLVGPVLNARNINFHSQHAGAGAEQDQKRNPSVKRFSYDEMWDRKHQIDKEAGSPDSVEWIWSTEFPAWLRDSSRTVFWITGNPGSGKSTLMKHIGDSTRTRAILGERGEKWTVMHFFFDFRRGTSIANSVPGLIRTLLHQLSEKRRDVAEMLRVDDQKDGHESVGNQTAQQLMSKFCDAIRSTGTRVCAFIDGLDEFKGDNVELINALSVLKDSAGIKMCLASRPQPLLKQQFSEFPYVVVHKHNNSSIRHYFETAWLNSCYMAKAPPQLCEELLKSARGNFVWARGAVYRMRQMLEECHPLHKLLEELRKMPKEVVELYEAALDRLPVALKREAAILLKLIIENGGRVKLDRLNAAFWTIVKRLDLYGFIQCRGMSGSAEIRVLTILGNLVEAIYGCRDLTAHETTSLCEPCKFSPRRLIHNGSTVGVSRTVPTEIIFAHETLLSGLRDRPWISEQLPPKILERYPDCLWLRLYFEEINSCPCMTSNFVATMHAEMYKFHSALPDLHYFQPEDIDEEYDEEEEERVQTDEEEEKESKKFDRQNELLLRNIGCGKNWSELAPFAVENVFDELQRCSDVSEELLDEMCRSLSHPILLSHYVICCGSNAIVYADLDDRCAFLFRTRSRRKLVCSTTNSVLRALAISVAHGLHETVEYALKHNLLKTADEKQIIFELVFEQYLTSSARTAKQLSTTTSVLGHLSRDGSALQSKQLCIILDMYNHPKQISCIFNDPLVRYYLECSSISLRRHHQFCNQKYARDFVFHWLEWGLEENDFMPSSKPLPIDIYDGIEFMLKILLKCDIQIDEPLHDLEATPLEIVLFGCGFKVRKANDKFAALVRAGANLSTVISILDSQIFQSRIAQHIAGSKFDDGWTKFLGKISRKLFERGFIDGPSVPVYENDEMEDVLQDINNRIDDKADSDSKNKIDNKNEVGQPYDNYRDLPENIPILESLLAQLRVFQESDKSSLSFDRLRMWATLHGLAKHLGHVYRGLPRASSNS